MYGQDSAFTYDNNHEHKDKLREILIKADSFCNTGKYIHAYCEYTKAGTMAYESGKFDFASEIYYRAIKLRDSYDLEISPDFKDRNLAYLNLCEHARQKRSDQCVFYHQMGIHQCVADEDTLSLLRLYKSLSLYYMDIHEEDDALKINRKALPISLAFSDTVEYVINLLDYSDLLNKQKDYRSADSVAKVGFELIHSYEIRHNVKNEIKWSFWFIQLRGSIFLSEDSLLESEKLFQTCLDSINDFKNRGGIDHSDLEYVTKIRLGMLYYELGNYKSADEMFLAAERLLEKPENFSFNKAFLYEHMLQTYKKAGVYQKAFEASEKYRFFMDEISKQAQEKHAVFSKDIATLHFENTEKELEIVRQERDQEKKDSQLTYLGIAIFAIGIIALLLLLFTRKQNRSNKQLIKMNDTISEQRDQITSSIEYAKKIQKAILPSNELMKICLPFSYVFYEPRDIVSGDFYWVSSVDKKVLVACADSTGHGVPGAIVSMIGNNGLNNCINEYGLTKPSQILDALTKYVEETFDKSVDAVRDGMDIALCLIDFENNKLEYSGANIPLYTTRGTELSVVKPDKQPIGKYEYRKPFTNHTINLVGVDNIYMCSDGIQDQFGGAKGKKFKIRRLKRLLMELSQQKLSRQKEMLKETFMEWKDGQEQVDDVCFIGITITND
jgi:serine phosphatase RsbU (regulator of sigma subunit)